MNNVYYFNLQDRMKFIKGFNMKTFGHFFVSVTNSNQHFCKQAANKRRKNFVSFFLFTVYHKKVQEYFT